jgi:hypothetical protein
MVTVLYYNIISFILYLAFGYVSLPSSSSILIASSILLCLTLLKAFGRLIPGFKRTVCGPGTDQKKLPGEQNADCELRQPKTALLSIDKGKAQERPTRYALALLLSIINLIYNG